HRKSSPIRVGPGGRQLCVVNINTGRGAVAVGKTSDSNVRVTIDASDGGAEGELQVRGLGADLGRTLDGGRLHRILSPDRNGNRNLADLLFASRGRYDDFFCIPSWCSPPASRPRSPITHSSSKTSPAVVTSLRRSTTLTMRPQLNFPTAASRSPYSG